ncbi:MAG: uracil-DNA glycosylase [Acidobacteria bacterium]|nr:uracil-DNA glycosylase [Acidobacteriota bacterium]
MVEAEALICTKCDLAEGRTQVVFGAGDPQADVLFVGEAPGQREDEQGVPFVGPSGRLLEELLAEIDLTRDAVYITNVVKCRPPGNRDPRPHEIDACKGYLRTQLELIDPAVVVTLGNFSTKLVLRTEVGITKLRGTAYEWWGRYLVPTFHPAAALRGRGQVLEDMRYDFSLIRDVLDGNLATDTGIEEETPPPPPADDPQQLGLFGQ